LLLRCVLTLCVPLPRAPLGSAADRRGDHAWARAV